MALIEKNNTFYMSQSVHIKHDIRSEDAQPYHAHTHNFVEFVYMLRGTCIHTIDETDYPVKRGDLLIINYNHRHNIAGGPGEFINILLKPEYISRNLINQDNAFALLNLAEFTDFQKTLDENKCKVTFTGEERDVVETLIFQMEAELQKQQPGYALSSRSLLNSLLVMIFRKMSLLLAEEFYDISDALLVYLTEHCGDKIAMADVAKQLHYDPAYFSRRFKAFAGVSFSAYLKNARILRAKHLLCNTGMKISDICQEVGYTDKTKFFRDFFQLTDMTPLAYRKSKK